MREITERLSRFGKVSIFNFGEGWVCSCEMFVTGEGVKVDIKSDRRMHTIEDAVRQCLERCVSCISELNTRTEKAPELKEALEWDTSEQWR